MFFLTMFEIMVHSFLKSIFSMQGTARRKKKVVHKTATADDKKLQGSLKKLAVNNIAGIEEVSHHRGTNAALYLFYFDLFLSEIPEFFIITMS